MGYSQIDQARVVLTTRCTIEKGRLAKGDGAWDRPQNAVAIDLTVAHTGNRLFIANECITIIHYARKRQLSLTLRGA